MDEVNNKIAIKINEMYKLAHNHINQMKNISNNECIKKNKGKLLEIQEKLQQIIFILDEQIGAVGEVKIAKKKLVDMLQKAITYIDQEICKSTFIWEKIDNVPEFHKLTSDKHIYYISKISQDFIKNPSIKIRDKKIIVEGIIHIDNCIDLPIPDNVDTNNISAKYNVTDEILYITLNII